MRGEFLLGLLALTLLGESVSGQQIPELTESRKQAVEVILTACEKAGAVKIEGKGATAVVRFDEAKLRLVLASQRGQINAGLVDALLASWLPCADPFKPLFTVLLRCCGEEKKDLRARGLAAFLGAFASERAMRRKQATPGYYQAARFFEAARQEEWLALSLSKAGGVLQTEGEYEEALTHHRQVLLMYQRLYPTRQYPGGHPLLARGLNNVGAGLEAKGEYEEALKHHRQALHMRQGLYPRQKYPQGHPDLAQSLNNVGAGLRAQGKHEQALKYFSQALLMYQDLYPRQKHPQGHPDLALSLTNVATTLEDQGQYEQALKHHRQALLMRQDLYPQGHPLLVNSLNNVGFLLRRQGESEEALKYYRQALLMRQRLFPQSEYPQGHPHLVASLNSVGSALHAQGEYEQALKYLHQSVLMCQGLYPTQKYPNGHPDLATSLNNMGIVLLSQRKYEEALKFLRQAVLMRQRLLPSQGNLRGHPSLASTLTNLGSVLQAQGEYQQALEYQRQALLMLQDLYPTDKYPHGHPDLAISLNNVGTTLHAQGEYEEALKYYRRAVRMWQGLYPRHKYPEGNPYLARGLTNVGVVEAMQGNPEQALKHYREALRMHQHEVERLASSAPEDRALNFASSIPLSRDSVVSVASRTRDSASSIYAAIWPSRSAVTRVFQRRHLALLAASSGRAKDLYGRLLRLRQDQTRHLLAPLPPNTQARDERLETLATAIEKVEQELLPLLPALARAEQLASFTPEQLQKALPARTAFVDLLRYVHFEQDPKVKGKKGERRVARYVAFVLSRQDLARVDLGEAKPIEESLDLWRRALEEGSQAAARHSQRLRELVWQKLARELKEVETVYLACEGKLAQLPWVGLRGEKPGTVLLEQFTLAVVPHGAFLLDHLTASKQKAEGKAVLLAVGGVSYDDQPRLADPTTLAKLDRSGVAGDTGLKWRFLGGTEKELKRIQEQSDSALVRALTGTAASTQRLLSELPQARVAHLATHGFFADRKFRSVLQLDESLFDRVHLADTDDVRRVGAGARSPLVLSGLVCAGANRPDTADRGILSADDLTRLDLRKLDLAVLSACETGLGDSGGGEGVFGLVRAFHVAGCRNVIASLWKVDDEATAALMVLFYRYLWQEKLPPIQALRQAQLALYHNPGKVKAWSAGGRGIDLKKTYTGSGKPPTDVKPDHKAHPKLWAAFSLSGLGR
jgi:CHAT domain-containing protein/Tfp pilus assembly protein PilF